MRQDKQIIATSVLTFICVSALAGKTNNAPVLAFTNAAEIARSMIDAEKLWEEKPDAYFREIRKNAKFLGDVGIDSDKEYQALFSSLTNLLNRPIPVNNKWSSEMLSSQSNALKNYMRNGRIRNDKDAWMVFAEYLGEIRSQIPPPPPHPVSNSSTNIVMPPSIEEWSQGRAKANYNLRLKKENRSLTSSLLIYMKNTSNRGMENEEYFQQLSDLASLTEEDRKKLGKR